MRRSVPAALLAALACGVPDPGPLARVTGAAPAGGGVPVGAAAELRFSGAVDGDGLLDGRRLVLAEQAALREAIEAVESEPGAAGPGVVPVRASLEDGGRRVVLRPLEPLRPLRGYAIVLSSLARAADGRPVLDPDGRHRTFVASFETGAPEGPPARVAITEVRADAETPEAGGEYVEVVNLGAAPLDLDGFRLAKRTPGGGLGSCAVTVPAGAAALPPGGIALLAGGAYDGRYALPAAVPVLSCGGTALLGGIANDRAPELLLADQAGTVVASLGANGAPTCPLALERLDPAAPDEPAHLACTEGSPGALR
jgi:hypothetical protein